jgi:hypothetical protein
MQKRMASRIGFGALGIALGILIVNGSLLLVGQNRPNPPQLPNTPKAPVSYPNAPVIHAQGVPAIKPSRPGTASAFTADELKQFLTSTDAPLGIKGLSNVSINRVDCGLTAAKVSNILHGKSIAVPADTSVCYAELKGDFSIPLPPLPQRKNRPTSLTFHQGFRVYDAKTGNVVAVGAFD